MSDIIQLLPDSVANQIAAGEVIQRPASVVKELVENAIDAGATSISLIIKDAGKTLIQVLDNGCGMSGTDTRLCFEKHATSKIKKVDDLFNIRTKGFRGEALASIAAIAQVELRTKLHEEELGTQIKIEGSKVIEQEPCSTPSGSSFLVKNLFFNVPARRNFLKSNPVETKHIIDEFQRVALTHSDVEMDMTHNGNVLFKLPSSGLRQRIVNIFGKHLNQKLVPVDESTTIVEIKGFVGKPEFAKKTRGDQFFFVNNRFIKNSYLNHAVITAFESLIGKGQHPAYFLYLTVPTESIDINIHPTKTEIKFEDDRSIYSIIRSAVKQALGKHNITPSIDFDSDPVFNHIQPEKGKIPQPPEIKIDPTYNPFNASQTNVESSHNRTSSKSNSTAAYKPTKPSYEQNETLSALYKTTASEKFTAPTSDLFNEQPSSEATGVTNVVKQITKCFQLHEKYIISPIRSGYLIVDQHRAHERILYEQLVEKINSNTGASQQELFPVTINLSPTDYTLIQELWPELTNCGFNISDLGNNDIAIIGVPAETNGADPKRMIEKILEQLKHQQDELKVDKKDNLARAMAHQMAIKSEKKLTTLEMNDLLDRLFACESPNITPNGKPILLTEYLTDLDRKFEKHV